ncbi:MAG: TonB-dependent receptor [Pseudomonadota bacterium]|nr:TonB-dependent receptor [Pseudomonadota bacterium]
MFVLAGAAAAQPQTLAPIVVTGTREPTPLDRVIGDVVVIDAEQIRRSSADSLEDLLRREGGIQLSRSGGPGQNAALLLRGSGASSTLVLVDGVRIGSATLGQVDLSAIGLAQIERIEILRGPGSSLYGADAVGGVVQIITRRGTGAPHLAAHGALGELHSSVADASVGGSDPRFDYAASLSRESSRGISAVKPGDSFGVFNPDRDGFARVNAQVRGGLVLAPGHRIGLGVVENRLNSRYDGVEFPPPNFSADASPDFRNHYVTRVTVLDYRGAVSRSWTTTVQVSGQSDDLLSGGAELSRFKTNRQQLIWQNAWRPAKDQQVVAAIERLDEKVEATPYSTSPRRNNTGAVLGYSGSLGDFKVQADARIDHNSTYGDVSTGKVGIAYDVQPGLTLRAVAGTAFRAPTFNDLYFPGFGVSTIGPEHSRSVEAGVQWKADASSASATVYRNRARDLIVFEADRSFCPADRAYDSGCARNVSRATLQGATLSAAHRRGAFAFRATLDFLDAKDAATGERLPRRAAHQESFAVDWSRGAWTAGAALLQVGARPEGGVVLPAYRTVDLQARLRLAANWRLEAKLLNAFDRRYEPQRDYQALGRQGWLGVRYDGAGL